MQGVEGGHHGKLGRPRFSTPCQVGVERWGTGSPWPSTINKERRAEIFLHYLMEQPLFPLSHFFYGRGCLKIAQPVGRQSPAFMNCPISVRNNAGSPCPLPIITAGPD